MGGEIDNRMRTDGGGEGTLRTICAIVCSIMPSGFFDISVSFATNMASKSGAEVATRSRPGRSNVASSSRERGPK